MRLLALGAGLRLLAQATPGEGLAGWLNFGTAGLVVLSIIVGWLASGRELDRAVERGDRLEAKLQERDAFISEKLVPALTRATDALDDRIVPALTRATSLLERLERK